MRLSKPNASSLSQHLSEVDSEGELDGITVTDITDEPAPAAPAGVLGSVLGVYERHGYDAGYRRAVQDVLLSLAGVTEQFIRERGAGGAPPEELRRIVWMLREDLEHRCQRANNCSSLVEGGLGI